MNKILMLLMTGLLSVLGAGTLQGTDQGPDDPPPPRKKGDPKKKGDEPKKKGEGGPAGDLRRAYDLLRRIKADSGTSDRPEERLREWTDRAVRLYRKGVSAEKEGDPRAAHEYGAAAHDLARAVDHARNASRFDRPDPDLPPPPEGPGPEGDSGRLDRELRHAYDRLRELADDVDPESRFYIDAARDLYKAARKDATSDRPERAGELARAAEAMTHVPEHLRHAADRDPEPKAKARRDEPKARRDRPEPKAKREPRPDEGGILPPPVPR